MLDTDTGVSNRTAPRGFAAPGGASGLHAWVRSGARGARGWPPAGREPATGASSVLASARRWPALGGSTSLRSWDSSVRCGVVWCGVVWCGVVWCGVVWCGVVWCGVVWCGVVWCGVVWCGVPKALLPKGKGRDVYPRVQVNGLGCVCCVRAVCKCVVA